MKLLRIKVFIVIPCFPIPVMFGGKPYKPCKHRHFAAVGVKIVLGINFLRMQFGCAQNTQYRRPQNKFYWGLQDIGYKGTVMPGYTLYVNCL